MLLAIVRRRTVIVFLIIILGVSLLAAAQLPNSLQVAGAQGATPSVAASPSAGQDAETKGHPFGDLMVTVEGIQEMPADIEASLLPANQALGRHVVVKFKVSNVSKHAVELWPTGPINMLVLIDVQGRVFSIDAAVTTFLTTRLSLHTAALQPGLTAEAVLVYDLPKDVASARLSNNRATSLGDYVIGDSSGTGFRAIPAATPSFSNSDVQSGCWNAADRVESTYVSSEGTTVAWRRWNRPPNLVIDTSKIYTATIKTNKGAFVVQLDAAAAPLAVNNFVCLAEAGYYDNTPVHRIVAGFIIQAGDPTGTGRGGPGYWFRDEPVTKDYIKGVVAMANAGPNTNGSQFFVCLESVNLPKNYTIFGQVTQGQDTVDLIGQTTTRIGSSGEKSTPIEPIMIENVTIGGTP